MPLKDAQTRFYSPVLRVFDLLLLRKPLTEDWSSATSPPNPQVSAPDGERTSTGCIHRAKSASFNGFGNARFRASGGTGTEVLSSGFAVRHATVLEGHS